MNNSRIMQRQELATARPVILPPGGETCDELVYLTTDTPQVPALPTPDEHEPLGPVALVAVTDDGQLVWARAFRLPYEVQQRRETQARAQAELARIRAIDEVLSDLHERVAGVPRRGSLRDLPLATLRAMARAEGLRGSRRYSLEYELRRWAEERVDEASHAR